MFLNTIKPYTAFKKIRDTRFFVDKTWLIHEMLEGLETDDRKYICITRPRRFGKSVMAEMIGAFLGKSQDSSNLFQELDISKSDFYKRHLNKHSIIYIDFSEEPEKCLSYDQYITRILKGLKDDLRQEYPNIVTDLNKAVWDILSEINAKTGNTYVFVIDEWDAVFHMPYVRIEDKQAYLRFLKSLLKGNVYVDIAYMTGILPIAKYSSGSELNVFTEYNMATRKKYGTYFGFLDKEVDRLFNIYEKTTCNPRITREELRVWYDGYYTAAGEQLYNPRSVVCALSDNQLGSYWTNSGPYDEVFYYMKNNVQVIRDDLALMVSGESVEARIQEYAATATELNTRDQIYSAMVVYGLLTYNDESGEVLIPNKELMVKFNELLMLNDNLGYIHRLARESERMLRATLAGDTKTMEKILKFAHDTESPIFSYNSEIELSAVVNLVYLSARDRYRVEREDKAGEGYVDFIFYPEFRGADCIILELKIDASPKEAIDQIKNKNYILRFKGKLGEKPKYTGRILAVGISYLRKTKIHSCQVEILG